MAAKLLLPGFGGKYTSETFTATDTTGADTIDVSGCDSWSIQVTASSPVGTMDVQQTFDGTNWAVLDNDSPLTNGTIILHGPDEGPYGRIRIDATDLTSGTFSVQLTGHRLTRNG